MTNQIQDTADAIRRDLTRRGWRCKEVRRSATGSMYLFFVFPHAIPLSVRVSDHPPNRFWIQSQTKNRAASKVMNVSVHLADKHAAHHGHATDPHAINREQLLELAGTLEKGKSHRDRKVCYRNGKRKPIGRNRDLRKRKT